MAEEKKKEKKPKATLIKHKQKESPDKQPVKQEKKVVVVKKKVVVVKKKARVVTEDKTKKTFEKKGEERRGAPSYQRTDRRNYSRVTKKPGGRGDFKKDFSKSRGGDKGKSTAKYNQERKSGPGQKTRAAKTDFKPATDDKKIASRRFIKTKKKFLYHKSRHEEHEEKLFHQKKKSTTKANPIPKQIAIMEVITVSDLAKKMNLKASELISKLMSMGMMVTINQQIDAETATILASEYGCDVKIVSLYDETIIEQEDQGDVKLLPRPPIVTVMGHVDHGKTKLLDAIRTTNIVDSEHGGITQHIGAYVVDVNGNKIVFLDTPGHEAFTLMRARGAQVTDIVILVVAADDGVMPQTIEAINHAKAGDVPIIVAINKTDLPDANTEKVKQQLAEYELMPETWGGHTLFNEISALKKQGINELLDSILLQAEMLELNANHDCNASGKVIESKIDQGRGIIATVLIQQGTLHVGDSFVAGIYSGKVRAMFNDRGEKVGEATPSIPVEILGFTGIPDAGDPFQVTKSEKKARQIGTKRQELKKLEEAQNVKKITLDNLYEQIKEGEIQELKVVIKGDVHGSVEALQTALEKLSTSEVRLNVIHALAGAINESDVRLASSSNALIIGFHVRPTSNAQILADREKVEIKKYNVIYDAVDQIKQAMEGMLQPEVKEEVVGKVEVRDTFKVPKIGMIAGCYVVSGVVRRGLEVRLIRDDVEIYRGKISSLKRFKEDVREVESGYECGIGIENYNDIKVGDAIEVVELKEYAKSLDEGKKDADDTNQKGK
ncbi:MAG: translation initiation factor IF-2 [Spirochaetales bacterium]|nr:translation initiation factor IF-2 [Spirochaetales bacterium]